MLSRPSPRTRRPGKKKEQYASSIFGKQRSFELPSNVRHEFLKTKFGEIEKIAFPFSRPEQALVYIHGGEQENGLLLCTEVARNTCQTVYAIHYRQTPEYPYPTAMLDCVFAWKWMLRNGINPYGSSFVGAFRGSDFALSSGLWCRDHGIPLPSSFILFFPDFGKAERSMASNEECAYSRNADCDDPYAHPLLGTYVGFPSIKLFAEDARESALLDAVLFRDGIPHSFTLDIGMWHGDEPVNELYVTEMQKMILETCWFQRSRTWMHEDD